MTLAIAHNEKGTAILDAVREHKPPFSPEAANTYAHRPLKLRLPNCAFKRSVN